MRRKIKDRMYISNMPIIGNSIVRVFFKNGRAGTHKKRSLVKQSWDWILNGIVEVPLSDLQILSRMKINAQDHA